MTDSRTTKMEEIRARVERDDYAWTPAKVADAIVARLLAGRSAKRRRLADPLGVLEAPPALAAGGAPSQRTRRRPFRRAPDPGQPGAGGRRLRGRPRAPGGTQTQQLVVLAAGGGELGGSTPERARPPRRTPAASGSARGVELDARRRSPRRGAARRRPRRRRRRSSRVAPAAASARPSAQPRPRAQVARASAPRAVGAGRRAPPGPAAERAERAGHADEVARAARRRGRSAPPRASAQPTTVTAMRQRRPARRGRRRRSSRRRARRAPRRRACSASDVVVAHRRREHHRRGRPRRGSAPIAARSDSAPASARQPASSGVAPRAEAEVRAVDHHVDGDRGVARRARTTAQSSPIQRTTREPSRRPSVAAIASISARSPMATSASRPRPAGSGQRWR